MRLSVARGLSPSRRRQRWALRRASSLGGSSGWPLEPCRELAVRRIGLGRLHRPGSRSSVLLEGRRVGVACLVDAGELGSTVTSNSALSTSAFRTRLATRALAPSRTLLPTYATTSRSLARVMATYSRRSYSRCSSSANSRCSRVTMAGLSPSASLKMAVSLGSHTMEERSGGVPSRSAMNTTGASSPLAACTVMIRTLPLDNSMSRLTSMLSPSIQLVKSSSEGSSRRPNSWAGTGTLDGVAASGPKSDSKAVRDSPSRKDVGERSNGVRCRLRDESPSRRRRSGTPRAHTHVARRARGLSIRCVRNAKSWFLSQALSSPARGPLTRWRGSFVVRVQQEAASRSVDPGAVSQAHPVDPRHRDAGFPKCPDDEASAASAGAPAP